MDWRDLERARGAVGRAPQWQCEHLRGDHQRNARYLMFLSYGEPLTDEARAERIRQSKRNWANRPENVTRQRERRRARRAAQREAA